MAEPHSRLLTLAAREVLRPMGLIQRGRSRIWLDDQGWWIGLVEFQPSAWSRGSYLNVGVSWPWHPTDAPSLYFELSHRVGGFVEFESEAQFQPEARRLATRAAEEIGGLRVRLATVRSAAQTLRESVGDDEGWPAWHAAVAWGLGGEQRSAKRLFARSPRLRMTETGGNR
jgi:hypothetical protein